MKRSNWNNKYAQFKDKSNEHATFIMGQTVAVPKFEEMKIYGPVAGSKSPVKGTPFVDTQDRVAKQIALTVSRDDPNFNRLPVLRDYGTIDVNYGHYALKSNKQLNQPAFIANLQAEQLRWYLKAKQFTDQPFLQYTSSTVDGVTLDPFFILPLSATINAAAIYKVLIRLMQAPSIIRQFMNISSAYIPAASQLFRQLFRNRFRTASTLLIDTLNSLPSSSEALLLLDELYGVSKHTTEMSYDYISNVNVNITTALPKELLKVSPSGDDKDLKSTLLTIVDKELPLFLPEHILSIINGNSVTINVPEYKINRSVDNAVDYIATMCVILEAVLIDIHALQLIYGDWLAAWNVISSQMAGAIQRTTNLKNITYHANMRQTSLPIQLLWVSHYVQEYYNDGVTDNGEYIELTVPTFKNIEVWDWMKTNSYIQYFSIKVDGDTVLPKGIDLSLFGHMKDYFIGDHSDVKTVNITDGKPIHKLHYYSPTQGKYVLSNGITKYISSLMSVLPTMDLKLSNNTVVYDNFAEVTPLKVGYKNILAYVTARASTMVGVRPAQIPQVDPNTKL